MPKRMSVTPALRYYTQGAASFYHDPPAGSGCRDLEAPYAVADVDFWKRRLQNVEADVIARYVERSMERSGR